MNRVLGALILTASSAFCAGCCECKNDPAVTQPSYEAAIFEVDGEIARMYGVIDHTTPDRVHELVSNHPEVDTIVMIDVPGSIDDSANLRASRMVREHGLRTVIPSDAVVASGGVDFFLAGEARSVETCAKLGVHSWDEDAEDGSLLLGNEVPKDHPIHTMFLDYYEEMGVSDDFYWFTLEAAPSEKIHWMSDEEILFYEMATGESH